MNTNPKNLAILVGFSMGEGAIKLPFKNQISLFIFNLLLDFVVMMLKS